MKLGCDSMMFLATFQKTGMIFLPLINFMGRSTDLYTILLFFTIHWLLEAPLILAYY
jgi:hypothetical protein